MTADKTSGTGYRFTRLTDAIDDKNSPLRRYLDHTFPDTKAVTRPHSASSPPMTVPGTPGVNAGTIGTAFDILIGLRYQPDTIPDVARPFARYRPDLTDGWANMLTLVAGDNTLIESAAWAYALAVEAFRSGRIPDALTDLLTEKGGYNEYDLLAIASAEAIEELASLEELAETSLYPHLGNPPAPAPTVTADDRQTLSWSEPVPGGTQRLFGPVFTASELCSADADLICEGTLYEFKTRLGTKNSRGARVDVLPVIDLYQLISYALFDTHDEYGIKNVAVYSARYARHTSWPLVELLSTLAGRPVDLADERAAVWALLEKHAGH